MFTIEITENEQNQRLDRFLRKYLGNAPLSYIYKILRKDVKVGGKRRKEDYILQSGDILQLYMPEEEVEKYRRVRKISKSKKSFRVVYEDENILLVNKPAGLLTHGDQREKKNHLANQVIDYLTEKGEYDPRTAKTFAPAPANRLDRNTSGLVIFCKNYQSLQIWNQMIRERGYIRKEYMALVHGHIMQPLKLEGYMEKDGDKNRVAVRQASEENEAETGKYMLTFVRPMERGTYQGMDFTLAEVEISTGRTHQIRAQLAQRGNPIVGDPKYGDFKADRKLGEIPGARGQFLHAYRLTMVHMPAEFSYLEGRSFQADLPKAFQAAASHIFRG